MRYKNEITGIGILICMWVMVAVSCLLVIVNSALLLGIFVLLGFGLLMTIIYIPTLIKALNVRKANRNIMANGIKLQGRIVNYSIGTHMRDRIYSVTVSYIDPYTCKEKQISTPPLSFDPVTALGSDRCSVYVFNDSYYVTDFVPRRADQANIWGKEIDTLEKKEIKKVLIGVAIFIIFFVAICLCCLGVIKF